MATPVEEMMRGQEAENRNEKRAKYKTRAKASIKTDCKNYSVGQNCSHEPYGILT